jgi:outer membrane protein assembly factor BamE
MKVMAMRYLVVLMVFLCASCSSSLPGLKPYHLDIQQGNVVTSKMMLQLKPGMTKSQVRYVMGTPLLQDSFHQDRWDYIYQMNKGGEVVERRRVILEFNNDGLAKVRGDVIPAGSPGAENAPMATIDDVKTAKSDKTLLNEDPKKSWTDRFKFWADDEKVGVLKTASEPEKTKKEESKASWLSSLKFWEDKDKSSVNVVQAKQVEELKPGEVMQASPVDVPKTEVTTEVVVPVDEKLATAPEEVNVPTEIAHAKEIVQVTPPTIESVEQLQEAGAKPVEASKSEAAVKAKASVGRKLAKKPQPAEPVNEAASQNILDPKEEIASMVNAWADAWRTKNINTYFKFYSDKFTVDGMTRQAWVAQRKQRIAGQPSAIDLKLENVAIDVDAKTARVEFLQHYSNGKFSDHVVKELSLANEQNNWVILRESVLSKSANLDVQKDNVLADIPKVREATSDEKSEAMPEKMIQDSAKEALKSAPEAKSEPVALPQEAKPVSVKSEQPPPQEIKPEVKESKPAITKPGGVKDPLPSEDAPGYFERMLEKIGF